MNPFIAQRELYEYVLFQNSNQAFLGWSLICLDI